MNRILSNRALPKLFMMSCVCGVLLTSLAAHAETGAPATPPKPLDLNAVFVKPIGPQGFAFTPQWLAANGESVTIQGFMVQQESAPQGRFLFAQRPVQMSEHADGEAQ